MPAGRVDQTIYGFNFLSTTGMTPLYKPGELGKQFQTTANKGYQIVQLDSGATAATGAGVVASGQVAFWKDRTNYLVTNDKVVAEGGPTIAKTINSVAGVFVGAVVAGNFCVVQQRGPHPTVLTSSGSAVAGDYLIALTTGGPAGALVVASGTALVSMPIGRATAATSTGATAATLGGFDVVDIP